MNKEKYAGYQYVVAVQCHGLVNHAQSEILMTCRVEDSDGKSMYFLKSLNKDPKIMKPIDIGEVDLLRAPYLDKEKSSSEIKDHDFAAGFKICKDAILLLLEDAEKTANFSQNLMREELIRIIKNEIGLDKDR